MTPRGGRSLCGRTVQWSLCPLLRPKKIYATPRNRKRCARDCTQENKPCTLLVSFCDDVWGVVAVDEMGRHGHVNSAIKMCDILHSTWMCDMMESYIYIYVISHIYTMCSICTCILCIVILIEPFRCCMISSVCMCARWSRGIAGACMRSKIVQIRQTHCAYLVHTICANTRVLTTIYIRGFRGSKQSLTQTDRTKRLPPFRNYLLYMCSNVDLFINKKNTNMFEFSFFAEILKNHQPQTSSHHHMDSVC